MDTDTYLWDRQPGESAQAYEAARLYFDLGADRSQEAVAQKCSKSVSLIRRWSIRWEWVERAVAYDAMLRTREAAQREQAQAAEAATWAARRAAEAEREWAFAEQLMERARAMLDFPLQTEEVQQDGTTIIVKPTRWSLRDAAMFADTAAKLARLAAGMETNRETLQGPNGEPLFAPADVQQALKQIAEGKAARAGD